jgi:hypothetical protein
MKKTHDKLENFRRLDIRSLHKAGYTNDGYTGQWGWHSNGEVQSTIQITTQKQQIILEYSAGNQSFNYPIQLEVTPCHYGGVRHWFICTGCNRRVATLFIASNLLFQCRKCQKLNYTSQQESKLDATRYVMYKLRNKLDWQYDNAWMKYYYKIKPKGMHQTTFDKLVDRHDKLENRANRYCMASFKALEEKYKN